MDTAGLSVYREKHVTPKEVASTGRKPAEYYVVRLSVQALGALNLTVLADEQGGGLPGHALIPEINASTYEENREALKAVLEELARLASQEIVHRPAG